MSLWFKNLPEGWEEAPLKSRLTRNDGGVWGDDPAGGDTDTVVLRSTEQRVDGAWNIEAPALRKLTKAEAESGRLHIGDLVVTKSSGSELHIGKTSLVTPEVAALNACYSNFMQRLRVNERTDPRFVHYWMNNELCREQFAYLSNSTSGLANLNGTVLGTARLAFPPLAEQERIANFLDEQTARIDALIAEKERLDSLLSEYRQSLISAAVTGRLNVGIPDAGSASGWAGEGNAGVNRANVAPLKRLASVMPSNVDKHSVDGERAVRLCNYVDVYKNERITEALDFMEATATDAQIDRFTLRANDVIVTKDSEEPTDIGIPAHVPQDLPGVVCGYHLAVLRPDPARLYGGYLHWALQSGEVHAYYATAATGISRYALGVQDLGMTPIHVPSVPEQQRIANFLDEQTARIDALKAHVKEHIALLREYRSSLISAAVTGQLGISTFEPH